MTERLIPDLERIASLIESNRILHLTMTDGAILREVAERMTTLRGLVDQLSDGVSVALEPVQQRDFAAIKAEIKDAPRMLLPGSYEVTGSYKA